jgi:hypothetical protein
MLLQTGTAFGTFRQGCTGFGADHNLAALISNFCDTPIVCLMQESGRLGQSFNQERRILLVENNK